MSTPVSQRTPSALAQRHPIAVKPARVAAVLLCLLTFLPVARAQEHTPRADRPAHPQTSAEDVVRADVAAQDAANWDAYLTLRSDLPGAPESQSNYAALWAQPDKGIRDNVANARIEGLREVPLDVAKQAIDTCCYTAENLRAFLVLINYTVRVPNQYVTEGSNARLYVVAETADGWKIVQVSEPLLQPLLDAGYSLGMVVERDLAEQQRELLQRIGQEWTTTESSRIHGETTQPYPATIKVAHFTTYSQGCHLLSTFPSMDFTTYIRNVLPNEWGPAASFNMEALKAGALAVKGVGWYDKAIAKYPGLGFDISDSDCDQVYKPNSALPRTDDAFCAVSGVAFQKANGFLFYPSYLGQDAYSNHDRQSGIMYQNGTNYLADHGYLYDGIARYYYDNSKTAGYQPIQFFTYTETGTACRPPTAPVVSAVATSSSAISVSWSGGANATSFLIYRGTGSLNLIATLSGTARSFADSGLLPSTTYYYQVCARNPGGTTCASTSARTLSFFGVQAPTGLTPNNYISLRGWPVRLSWNGVPGALWYNAGIMRWTGSTWVNVGTYYAGGARYDAYLAPNTWYAWHAQAVGVVGAGPWSDWAYFYLAP